MEAMPRPRWPHLLREVSRHGTVRWVVRVGHGARIAIRESYGTPEFERAYYAALLGEGPQRPRLRRDESSLEWLVARYQASSNWLSLAKGTRRLRQGIFKRIVEGAGEMPYRAVTKEHIVAGRERRQRTPNQANAFIIVMRSLFSWAVEHEFVDSDPTEGVKTLKLPKTRGFKAAIEDDIAKFGLRWPKGTREYLALTIFLETGLRRGDAARVGRQHIKNGFVVIRTEKTGQLVRIPISDKLADAIEATPSSGLVFITKADGMPLTKESLGNWFHDACKSAGVHFSAHGLRKAAAARLVDIGLTEAELEQVMGWAPGSNMSRIYTRRRNDETLANRVADKLRIEKRTIYSQPSHKVGNDSGKG
jgi:integrase